MASATEKTNNSDRFKGVGNVYATYMITKGLEARVSIGGNLSYDKNDFYAPENTLQGRQTGGYGSVSTSKSFRWVNENTISYENEFLGLHKLDLLGGFTLERATSENLRGASAGFVTDAFEYHNLNAGEVPSNPATGASESSLVSYIGRVHYGFDERYLVTLTGRIDGSSRFGEGNKYGFFPSGALAWRVTNEPFMEDQNVFSNIKLRLSYGVTGNQAIGNYAALTQLGNSQVTFGDRVAVGINPASLGNEDLRWEKTTQYNAGLDLGLFNNRISLTTDIYYKKTTDLLLIRRVPRYTGYTQYLDNIGSTENRGIELTLDTQNITNSNFSWTSSVNFAMNRNEVLKLSDGEPLLVGTPISYASGQSFRIIQEGKSLGAFYGYKYGGVYSDQQEINNNPAASSSAQPGDPYLLDISGPEGQPDGTIDGNDRTIVGNGFPDFTFGFTNNFVYRGFDLSFFIQGLYGNEILNMNTLRLETGRGYLNQTSDLLNRWTPENRNTDIPRAARSRSSASQTAMRAISSRLIEDGSYVRLKNITLGYSFPVDWINRFGARSVRLYVSAQNLYTLTNYSGYDPEVSTYNNLGNLGADYGTYPKAKTYLMGIELGF
ncbi:TonB-dependent receptor [Aliifodinibius sp. S!AR15-10]|uniref:SusC/RagA family TonB-linked outer membrane protein n=1 Tax=Aliifodinibius sp. S!AR15-10 TaxID=2950437 RepID=UPI00285ED9CE|nr:SusC/RagA family TonB-linked outer membrane protein [Aliifodinibius sp. S!AR15-10]MDR8390668.1 TonB-dependent receptor [Aliifodinibius sp. S!AR15-10]